MQYYGALFDYDGTLTQRYHDNIPDELIQATLALSKKGIMMGICTARTFANALPKFAPFSNAIGTDVEARKNWVLICENGCKGYRYDASINDYIEFYSVAWPEQIDREALYQRLLKDFGEHVEILNNKVSMEIFQREDAPLVSTEINRDPANAEDLKQPDVEKNEVSIILRPHGRMNMGPKEWELASDIIYQRVLKIMAEFDKNGLLHVGNSKMGVSILPANGDKDRGIMEFAALVANLKAVNIEAPFKNIVAVGDQATVGGNDYYFLKGDVGTTFNVGEEDATKSIAGRVLNDAGLPLIGPAGTIQVLRKLFG